MCYDCKFKFHVASSHATNPDIETVNEENNLPDILYQNLRDNVNLCETHILDEQTFDLMITLLTCSCISIFLHCKCILINEMNSFVSFLNVLQLYFYVVVV